MRLHKLEWHESINGIRIECSLNVAVHPGQSNVVLVIVPGVDGSLDGFENKYVRIAESISNKHRAAVVRMDNPFISSFHWKSNFQRIMEFIEQYRGSISPYEKLDIRVMSHSAGAAVASQISWQYPDVTRLLLINPAANLGTEKIRDGLERFRGDKVTILSGSSDPSFEINNTLSDIPRVKVVTAQDADHNFSGSHIDTFIAAPHLYLFSD